MASEQSELPGFLTPEKARELLEENQKTIAKMIEDGKPLPRHILDELRATAVSDRLGPSTNPTQLYAKSKNELAKLLGISKPTLDTLFKREGHPGAESNNTYSVAKWRRFGAQHVNKLRSFAQDDDGEPATPKELDPAYIRARAQAESAQLAVEERKFDLALKQGQYIKIEDASSEVLRCNGIFKRELTRAIAALDIPSEIREKVETALQNALANLHKGGFN